MFLFRAVTTFPEEGREIAAELSLHACGELDSFSLMEGRGFIEPRGWGRLLFWATVCSTVPQPSAETCSEHEKSMVSLYCSFHPFCEPVPDTIPHYTERDSV